MIVVVDGYNVLKNVAPHDKVTHQQRTAFIAHLRAYATKKRLEVVIVFDAGPSSWASQEQYGPVCVVYAGAGNSADDYIKHYLRMHATKDVLLVSSDNELRTCAARLSIPSLKAAEFYQFFTAELEAQEPDHFTEDKELRKTSGEKNPELDTLMAAGTKKVPHKMEDEESTHEKGAAYKASKEERALLKKLKKL